MKGKDYTGYSVEQLLEDDFFLKSYFYPTDNSQAFWKEQALRDEVLAKEIVYAQMVLRSIPYRKQTFSSEDKELLWKRISKTNHKKRSFRYWYSSVAAVAILLLTVGSFYYMNYYEEDNLTAIEKVQKPEQPVGTVLLILADEKKADIEEKNSHLQYNKKGELHINARKMKTSQDSVTSSDNKNELIYNQLIVPSARRSFLELADGSKIWVNANTRVVYPVTFDDKKREIYVDGEIYIEVSPEEKRPFIVKSKKMDIRVLGTKFNVSAYSDDSYITTTLLEGAVELNYKKDQIRMSPGESISLDLATGQLKGKKVNARQAMAWAEDRIEYDDITLGEMVKKLSRQYDVHIQLESEKLGDMKFRVSLRNKETIVDVMDALKEIIPIKVEYKEKDIYIR